MRSRRLVTTVLSTALIATLLAAVPGTAEPAQAAGSDDLSVTELDLDGVETADLAALPDPESVPTEEGAQDPAASVQRAAGPEPDPTSEPTADPTITAAPSPSPDPTEAPAPEQTTEAAPDVLTTELDTADFSVLGVTWDRTEGLEGVQIRYRVRIDGEWTDWSGLESSDIGPDDGTDDAETSGDRDGTDPIVAVGADGVQIWAEAASGTVTGLKAVLIDPGSDPADVGATVDGTGSTTATTASDTTAVFQNLGTATDTGTVRTAALAQPGIISRAGWGADESLRGCTPDYSRSMVSAAVHHTASANGYTAAAVPGIIRGFYAYHTRPEAAGGRGWCDIGYNFLVDQYGRIFEGRAGGITSTVVGVHTGGFNSRTIGVAAIGDYSSYGPSGALAESISQLIAWKFAVHRIQANASVTMTSGGGASKYPAGTVVTFPTIYAHRDAALTSCPGQALYNLLPDIRNRVAQLANATVAASPRWSLDSLSATSGGIALRGWAFDPDSDVALPVRVSVDGAVQTLTANQSQPDVASSFGVGPNHGFSGTVTAGNGRHLVCVSIGNVGAGQDVVIACDWLTVQNAAPIGNLDAIGTTPTSISVRGWALDPDTRDPIRVHVYVDGRAVQALTADQPRPDIDRAYGKGPNHGFDATIDATGGRHEVCLYLINQPAGANVRLTCRTVDVGKPPMGVIDAVATSAGSVSLSGWALDPDTTDSIRVHAYVDGKGTTAVTADRSRPDVGRAHGLGDAHGFAITLPVADGTHEVCLFLINTPSGPNTKLCRTVTVRNAAPFGRLDTMSSTAQGVTFSGWALDPDTTDPIRLHVYVDGTSVQALTADRTRTDVGRAYGQGDDHGFSGSVPLSTGRHQVCLYLINTPTGSNPLLTCRDVTVTNAAPVGALDAVTPSGGGQMRVRGWALDTDVDTPVSVHLYLDGGIVQRVSAEQSRPDVGRARGTDGMHGFDTTVQAAAGRHELCAYAINQPVGPNTRLGCMTVDVTD
ncbi:N-acetylmuramoyl-L-alanine amidase [Cellulomonas denverensis]|uniref:N-acetylmuramoyl-L-alanine amidase n=1 Tax=Cellulomonas denverensis TaxID=264297 RepID=UPI0035F0E0F2